MKSDSPRLSLRLLAAAALAVSSLGATVGVNRALAADPICGNGAVGTGSCTYTLAGDDTFTPPSGVTSVTVHAIGGTGGAESGNSFQSPVARGGYSADVTVTGVSVTSATTYHVDVGTNGATENACVTTPAAGGSNGGGAGGTCYAGGGGGASGLYTDVAHAATASDLVVAAGGGGAGSRDGTGLGGHGGDADTSLSPDGGAGAADPSCVTATGGGGGTSSTFGVHGTGTGSGTDGGPNQGGSSAPSWGGGGGGGYYGGGGGGENGVFNCGAGGGAGSSFAVSGTPAYGQNTSGAAPAVVISWSPTVAAAVGLHVAIARGWTTMTWRSASHVLGFNVYRGSRKLNRMPVSSASQRYSFRLHAVVRHPVLRAVMQR